MAENQRIDDHYGDHYRQFSADVTAEVRRAAFGDDVGQNSWLKRDELERFGSLLRLGASRRLLDVGCGSGGPALYLADQTGCAVVGVEVDEFAVAHANRMAREQGIDQRVSFVRADASQPLPFESASFDAILCIDAINHLRDRPGVLADWARLLRPGGRVVFTDPVTMTGFVDSEELAIRTSIGYVILVPPGEDERLLTAAGLRVIGVEDTTDRLAEVAQRRHDARAEHATALRQAEGDQAFDGRQRFFGTVARLASERRVSRVVLVAERDRNA